MSFWTELRLPTERELVVGFYDLTGYMRFANQQEPQDLLALMSGYFAFTGRIVHDADGRLIKTIGDAGLVAFPAEGVEAAVGAMQAVQSEGDAWLAAHGCKSNAIVKLHLGPVAIGKVGAPGAEVLDVYGKTVNVAATLQSTGFAMTPAVFRRLPPAARTAFKKHTPPVSYIEATDRRPRPTH